MVRVVIAAATWEPVDSIRPWPGNPRVNADAVDPVARSILRLGFGAPILVRSETREVVAGHTRLLAVRHLLGHVLADDGSWRSRTREDGPLQFVDAPGPGLVPVRSLALSESDARALALADNRLGEIAEWDDEKLGAALAEIQDAGADLDYLGWSNEELDALLDPLPVSVLGGSDARPSGRGDSGATPWSRIRTPDGDVPVLTGTVIVSRILERREELSA